MPCQDLPIPHVSDRKVAERVIVGTFIHNYRWGNQIRGDERGYLEKAKQYRALGIESFTLERFPSIQDRMGERIYTSLMLGNCVVPPRNVGELLILSLLSIRAAVRRYPSRPRAIYAYNQDIENLWVGYLLKLLIGAPLVVIYHQIERTAFVSLRSGIEDRTRRGFHPVRLVYNSLLPALNRFAASHVDVHIALSEATREDVERILGVRNCAVIGNGLDTAKFRPLNLPKRYDAVFLGRLARQKGIDVLLKAWSQVIQEDSNRQLVLLGGGEPEEVSSYKSLAKDLKLEGNVTFAGFVGDEDLVRVLNSSKLFVFPSRKEGFAQAVSQAMGCGLCCILSDIPPLKEVYGESAVYFPVDNPLVLAATIERMLEDGDGRTLFGNKARRLAESFSWEDTVKRELALILGEPRSG